MKEIKNEEPKNKQPNCFLTDWLDNITGKMSESEQVEIMCKRPLGINLIQFFIIYVPLIIVMGLIMYFINYMIKESTAIIVIGIFVFISGIIITAIYPLCVNLLQSKYGRWCILIYIIISSFFCACFMGAISDVLTNSNISKVSQIIYYLWYVIVFCFNYRVIYEYSWKKFNNLTAFTNIVESAVFVLTIVSLIVPINKSIIVPISISCLVMVCAKLNDVNSFNNHDIEM